MSEFQEQVYYLVTYNATGYNGGKKGKGLVSTEAIETTPAEFLKSCYQDDNISDGPYVILYAEPITREPMTRNHLGPYLSIMRPMSIPKIPVNRK